MGRDNGKQAVGGHPLRHAPLKGAETLETPSMLGLLFVTVVQRGGTNGVCDGSAL